MKIKHALQEYLLEIEVRKYTQKTIRSYRNKAQLNYADTDHPFADNRERVVFYVSKRLSGRI